MRALVLWLTTLFSLLQEHAPAQSVAIEEEVLEVRLARYGGDIEMNMNLFLIPEEAREEFDIKLTAQKCALQAQLTEIAYKTIVQQGLSLKAAYQAVRGGQGNMVDYDQLVFGGTAVFLFLGGRERERERSEIVGANHGFCAQPWPSIRSRSRT